MYIDDYGSRRKGRKWIEKHWPNHVMIKLGINSTPSGALAWAKDKTVYYDTTHRRWWFKDGKTAIEFKLKFGGKIYE